jgi:hypothetical protein
LAHTLPSRPGPATCLTRMHRAPSALYTISARPGMRAGPDTSRPHTSDSRRGPRCPPTRLGCVTSPFHATARAPAPVRERGRMDSLPGQAPRARWQLWTCCSSTQQVQACSTGGPDPPGAGCGRGPTTRTASPSPPPAHRQPLRGSTSPSSYTRATRRGESSAGGEGLPQTTPLLSVRG